MLRESLSNALKNRGRKRKRLNIDKLKNEDLNLYQQNINEKLEDTYGIQDVQIERNKIKNIVVEAAKESTGEKGKRNEEWFDKECRMAIQEKNNRRKIMLQRMTKVVRKLTENIEGQQIKYAEKGKERC